MRRYSAFALVREAFRGHAGWERAWRDARAESRPTRSSSSAPAATGSPPPTTSPRTTASQRRGAREGLARRRQHRAQHHDHPLELPAGRRRCAIYEKARSLYETLIAGAELQRHVQPARRADAGADRARAARLEAHRACEPPRRHRERVRRPRAHQGDRADHEPRRPALPGARRAVAAARRHRPPRRRRLGLCPRRQRPGRRHHPELRGAGASTATRAASPACAPRAAPSAARGSASSSPAHSGILAEHGRLPAADRERRAAGAGLRADQAAARLRRDGQHRPRLRLASPTRARW